MVTLEAFKTALSKLSDPSFNPISRTPIKSEVPATKVSPTAVPIAVPTAVPTADPAIDAIFNVDVAGIATYPVSQQKTSERKDGSKLSYGRLEKTKDYIRLITREDDVVGLESKYFLLSPEKNIKKSKFRNKKEREIANFLRDKNIEYGHRLSDKNIDIVHDFLINDIPIKESSADDELFRFIAINHKIKGNLDKAISFYLQVIETSDVTDDLYELANIYYEKGDIPNFVLYHNKAIKQNYIPSVNALTKHYAKRGDTSNMFKYAKIGVKKNDINSINALIKYHSSKKQWTEVLYYQNIKCKYSKKIRDTDTENETGIQMGQTCLLLNLHEKYLQKINSKNETFKQILSNYFPREIIALIYEYWSVI